VGFLQEINKLYTYEINNYHSHCPGLLIATSFMRMFVLFFMAQKRYIRKGVKHIHLSVGILIAATLCFFRYSNMQLGGK